MKAPANTDQPGFSLRGLKDPGSMGFQWRGEHYFAVQLFGKLRVYRNRCPHRQLGLNWQEHDFLDDSGQLIRCASHGALFLVESGECVSGPCLGARLEAVAFALNGDRLYILPPAGDRSERER